MSDFLLTTSLCISGLFHLYPSLGILSFDFLSQGHVLVKFSFVWDYNALLAVLE
jgi:hypothetical protein